MNRFAGDKPGQNTDSVAAGEYAYLLRHSDGTILLRLVIVVSAVMRILRAAAPPQTALPQAGALARKSLSTRVLKIQESDELSFL